MANPSPSLLVSVCVCVCIRELYKRRAQLVSYIHIHTRAHTCILPVLRARAPSPAHWYVCSARVVAIWVPRLRCGTATGSQNARLLRRTVAVASSASQREIAPTNLRELHACMQKRASRSKKRQNRTTIYTTGKCVCVYVRQHPMRSHAQSRLPVYLPRLVAPPPPPQLHRSVNTQLRHSYSPQSNNVV